ncbi:hypothetical protein [Sulfuracidifex tepidarius]|uniref:Uncharacterized protein n=1 Tax=Sulfuracidifex tepidarius TaxID=1294262 RepID=A0A510E444_9CREN|nr:hypothetical protein [Sulfuracidifex tepidarius]BBG27291.1 hypothetical protein IC007_1836 [Sulfuracidifex tepidarius]
MSEDEEDEEVKEKRGISEGAKEGPNGLGGNNSENPQWPRLALRYFKKKRYKYVV